jgi:hypothetical protein
VQQSQSLERFHRNAKRYASAGEALAAAPRTAKRHQDVLGHVQAALSARR